VGNLLGRGYLEDQEGDRGIGCGDVKWNKMGESNDCTISGQFLDSTI